MPRVSRQQADLNRGAIVEAASHLFRERGLDGVSVPELTSAAGLTHGGFYGHFESKEALAAEAVDMAFVEAEERWKRRMAGRVARADRREGLVEGYLATRNKSNVGGGCAMASLVIDITRAPADSAIRASFLIGMRRLLAMLEEVEPGDAEQTREAALADLSTMVGALILARATAGSAVSGELLSAARARLAEGS